MIAYTDIFAPLNSHIYMKEHHGPRPDRIHSARRNPPNILIRQEETKANIARFGFSEEMYKPHTLYFPNQVIEHRKPTLFFPLSTVINLNYKWSTEYYHFLTEALPNAMFACQYLPNMHIYCMTSKFTIPAFRWFGVGSPIVSSPVPDGYIQMVPRYVECGNPSPEKIQLLRSVVESKVQFASTHGIIIRRHGSRELLNEGEVLDFMKQKYAELTWVIFDSLSFEDTAMLFSKAAKVVGPHGAGMTNMIFSPKGVEILEFMPITDTNVCYWHLSEMLGHQYSMFPLPCDRNGSMRVDIDELSSVLQ